MTVAKDNARLRRAREKLRQAGRDFDDEANALFCQGRRVTWIHSGHLQEGTVEKYIGTSQYVFVRNAHTGKSVRLYASRLKLA